MRIFFFKSHIFPSLSPILTDSQPIPNNIQLCSKSCFCVDSLLIYSLLLSSPKSLKTMAVTEAAATTTKNDDKRRPNPDHPIYALVSFYPIFVLT